MFLTILGCTKLYKRIKKIEKKKTNGISGFDINQAEKKFWKYYGSF